MGFAENLKLLRTMSGESQSVAATAIGVTGAAWSMYESGQRQPSLESLKKIALYFGVTTDALLSGIEEEEGKGLTLAARYEQAKRQWSRLGFKLDDESSRGYIRIEPPKGHEELWELEISRSDFLKLTMKMNENCRHRNIDQQLYRQEFEIMARIVTNKRAAQRRENPFCLIGKMVPIEYLPTTKKAPK